MHIRRSVRLKEYDYSSNGAYFVTICTQNRDCLFGTITVGADTGVRPPVVLSDAGQMIADVWKEIPTRYPGIAVDEFVVMPNHVHGIIVISEASINEQAIRQGGQTRGSAPTKSVLSLPQIIQRFKTLTTKLYSDGVKQSGWRPYRERLWQRDYYEHVIRNEDEFNDVRQYIVSNPVKWSLDRENPEYRI